MWPLAFCSITAPCTDLSDTWPLPPRHLTSPFTVSAVTAPCAPSTSMSVETPWRFRFIQAGALIWYSTIRSEEHTSELQSQSNLVCRLLLENKNNQHTTVRSHPSKPRCSTLEHVATV